MSKNKRAGRSKSMIWVLASRDQTSLPEWLAHPLTAHEPVYNPAIKVGAIRRALIWATARYPKSCLLLLLACALAVCAALLIVSAREARDELIMLALIELPLLSGLIYTLWPTLLYRLTGLPKPAARPSNRSAKQRSARLYYRGSCVTRLFLAGSAAVLWFWFVIFAQTQYKRGAGPWGAVAICLMVVPFLGFSVFQFLRAGREMRGLFVKPSLSLLRQNRKILAKSAGSSARRVRRQKTLPEQEVEQMPEERPT